MTGKVIGSERREYTDSPNKLLAVTDVAVKAIKYTGSNGQVQSALAMVYGTAEDGKPGVFILVDGDKMRDNITVAAPHIRRGVLESLQKDQVAAKIAEKGDAAEQAMGG